MNTRAETKGLTKTDLVFLKTLKSMIDKGFGSDELHASLNALKLIITKKYPKSNEHLIAPITRLSSKILNLSWETSHELAVDLITGITENSFKNLSLPAFKQMAHNWIVSELTKTNDPTYQESLQKALKVISSPSKNTSDIFTLLENTIQPTTPSIEEKIVKDLSSGQAYSILKELKKEKDFPLTLPSPSTFPQQLYAIKYLIETGNQEQAFNTIRPLLTPPNTEIPPILKKLCEGKVNEISLKDIEKSLSTPDASFENNLIKNLLKNSAPLSNRLLSEITSTIGLSSVKPLAYTRLLLNQNPATLKNLSNESLIPIIQMHLADKSNLTPEDEKLFKTYLESQSLALLGDVENASAGVYQGKILEPKFQEILSTTKTLLTLNTLPPEKLSAIIDRLKASGATAQVNTFLKEISPLLVKKINANSPIRSLLLPTSTDAKITEATDILLNYISARHGSSFDDANHATLSKAIKDLPNESLLEIPILGHAYILSKDAGGNVSTVQLDAELKTSIQSQKVNTPKEVTLDNGMKVLVLWSTLGGMKQMPPSPEIIAANKATTLLRNIASQNSLTGRALITTLLPSSDPQDSTVITIRTAQSTLTTAISNLHNDTLTQIRLFDTPYILSKDKDGNVSTAKVDYKLQTSLTNLANNKAMIVELDNGTKILIKKDLEGNLSQVPSTTTISCEDVSIDAKDVATLCHQLIHQVATRDPTQILLESNLKNTLVDSNVSLSNTPSFSAVRDVKNKELTKADFRALLQLGGPNALPNLAEKIVVRQLGAIFYQMAQKATNGSSESPYENSAKDSDFIGNLLDKDVLKTNLLKAFSEDQTNMILNMLSDDLTKRPTLKQVQDSFPVPDKAPLKTEKDENEALAYASILANQPPDSFHKLSSSELISIITRLDRFAPPDKRAKLLRGPSDALNLQILEKIEKKLGSAPSLDKIAQKELEEIIQNTLLLIDLDKRSPGLRIEKLSTVIQQLLLLTPPKISEENKIELETYLEKAPEQLLLKIQTNLTDKDTDLKQASADFQLLEKRALPNLKISEEYTQLKQDLSSKLQKDIQENLNKIDSRNVDPSKELIKTTIQEIALFEKLGGNAKENKEHLSSLLITQIHINISAEKPPKPIAATVQLLELLLANENLLLKSLTETQKRELDQCKQSTFSRLSYLISSNRSQVSIKEYLRNAAILKNLSPNDKQIEQMHADLLSRI